MASKVHVRTIAATIEDMGTDLQPYEIAQEIVHSCLQDADQCYKVVSLLPETFYYQEVERELDAWFGGW